MSASRMKPAHRLSLTAGFLTAGCLISVLLLLDACGGEPADAAVALPNPSFESAGERGPEGWRARRWGGRRQQSDFDHTTEARTGERSVSLASESGADISWSATVVVRPFSRYRLSGWIRTEEVEPGTGAGALLNLHGLTGARSEAVTGTRDWTEVAFEFDTGANDAVQVNCLFGGWGSATGQAWYDDLELELLETTEPEPAVTIAADTEGHPVNPYIYGQFIEHLGRCIYGGIWAEMLTDRKFWYVPGSEESPWSVVGGDRVMRLEQTDSFVGEQTPVITPAGNRTPAGLSHGALALEAGREYVGRVVLAGETGIGDVSVSLVWGEEADQRQTVTVSGAGPGYVTTPLHFRAGAGTDSGRLEITAAGRGELSIGTTSLMPADNIEGFRADTLELLRELNAPVYRWPGGNFVSGYDWRDGIGDPDHRPPRKNPAWQGIEHNDVGLHEFLRFCELLDTEPYITVNTGLGTVESAAEEVEYCNGSTATPQGVLRAGNGHPEPFRVTWWAIGNEMYGGWQLGHMPLEEYVRKHNRVVEAMRRRDDEIIVVAVGAVGSWSELTLRECADHMDYISEHFYVQERPGLLGHTAWAAERVREIAEAHREYRREIPGLVERNILIALDEWNYWYGPYLYGELGVRYFLKDALGIARGLHEFTRQSDIYVMANYAQTVNVIGAIKTTPTEAAFATTGLVLTLYRNHYGSIPVEVSGDMRPLDVVAAWTDDRSALTVAVINPTRERVRLPVTFSGFEPAGRARHWLITGPDPQAYNEPGGQMQVAITETARARFGARLQLAPMSVNLYRLEPRR